MSKRKKVETDVSSLAPKRKSIRIARQESLVGATKEDMEALNATFKSASNENEVIPDVRATNFPDAYVLPNLKRRILRKEHLSVGKISGITNGHVKTFINKLHRVVANADLTIGTDESKTNSLVAHLLNRVIDFDNWPFAIRHEECYRLPVSNKNVSAKPEFVVDMEGITMIVVGDKHLNNVSPPHFGEAQMLAEILACGYENVRLSRAITDQTILAVRIIFSYVTFYKAEIPVAYWKELQRGLPRKQSITILRWPGENDPKTGLDLAKPVGRRSVLTALIKIQEINPYILDIKVMQICGQIPEELRHIANQIK
ncbi:13037_t:CDS:2 [Acaulospora colombiana]|uniref:13037_t:CDS:1 n=1 Tax=Acaulospora colombiana TaxID=27376 RepID=A0ACA9KMT3_9GLOM|nr:13037_t:CDS:2 [Acaulospora colombiana]